MCQQSMRSCWVVCSTELIHWGAHKIIVSVESSTQVCLQVIPVKNHYLERQSHMFALVRFMFALVRFRYIQQRYDVACWCEWPPLFCQRYHLGWLFLIQLGHPNGFRARLYVYMLFLLSMWKSTTLFLADSSWDSMIWHFGVAIILHTFIVQLITI